MGYVSFRPKAAAERRPSSSVLAVPEAVLCPALHRGCSSVQEALKP